MKKTMNEIETYYLVKYQLWINSNTSTDAELTVWAKDIGEAFKKVMKESADTGIKYVVTSIAEAQEISSARAL